MHYENLPTEFYMASPPVDRFHQCFPEQRLHYGDGMMIAEAQSQSETMMFRYLQEPQQPLFMTPMDPLNDMSFHTPSGLHHYASYHGQFHHSGGCPDPNVSSPRSSAGPESLSTGMTAEGPNSISSASSPVMRGIAPTVRHDLAHTIAYTQSGYGTEMDAPGYMEGSDMHYHTSQQFGSYEDLSPLAFGHNYQCLAEEGYQPVEHEDFEEAEHTVHDFGDYTHVAEDHDQIEIDDEDDVEQEQTRKDSVDPAKPSTSVRPNIRTRRPSSNKAGQQASKTQKANKSSRRKGQVEDQPESPVEDNTARTFPCPLVIYGCKSLFGSKNEWKRHINTQHMRPGFWRCDQCPPNVQGIHNDFNRKDLFTQHIKRMHQPDAQVKPVSTKTALNKKRKAAPEDATLADASQRCYITTRHLPETSRCLFCTETFGGPGSWDTRLEHMGQHMERAKRTGEDLLNLYDWTADNDVEQYLLDQGIIVRHRQGLICTELVKD